MRNEQRARRNFIGRIQQYMEKAVHEAKVNLSWLNPNPQYVDAMNSFIAGDSVAVQRGKANLFWDSLQKFMPPVIYFGLINSLAQTRAEADLLRACPTSTRGRRCGTSAWSIPTIVDRSISNYGKRMLDRACRAITRGKRLWTFATRCCATAGMDVLKMWVTVTRIEFPARAQAICFRTASYLPLACKARARRTRRRLRARHSGECCHHRGSAVELHADERQRRATAWARSGATPNWHCRQRRLAGGSATSSPVRVSMWASQSYAAKSSPTFPSLCSLWDDGDLHTGFAIGNFDQLRHFLRELWRKRSRLQSPGPASVGLAGNIHSRVAVQSQHILNRNNARLATEVSAARMNAQFTPSSPMPR